MSDTIFARGIAEMLPILTTGDTPRLMPVGRRFPPRADGAKRLLITRPFHRSPAGYPPDTGCGRAPSCLACPFDRCRYDAPHPRAG